MNAHQYSDEGYESKVVGTWCLLSSAPLRNDHTTTSNILLISSLILPVKYFFGVILVFVLRTIIKERVMLWCANYCKHTHGMEGSVEEGAAWSARRKRKRNSNSSLESTSDNEGENNVSKVLKTSNNEPASIPTTAADQVVPSTTSTEVVSTENTLQCGICFTEDIEEQGILNSCIHVFCFMCIFEWSKVTNTCPFWYLPLSPRSPFFLDSFLHLLVHLQVWPEFFSFFSHKKASLV